MKNCLFIVLFFCLSFFTFSQDIIIKNNGDSIQSKVLEITDAKIQYMRFTQPDGPLRSIEKGAVEKIVYADGTVEVFTKKKKRENTKDLIFKSGFYIDFSFGFSQKEGNSLSYIAIYPPLYNTYRNNYLSTNIKLGNSWYFGNRPNWRPGIQVQWIRYSAYIEMDKFLESLVIGDKNFSLLNVGMANAFKISDKIGIEANFVTGLNMNVNVDFGRESLGIAFSPEIKLRFNKIALGINYQYIRSIDNFEWYKWNTINLSFGVKF